MKFLAFLREAFSVLKKSPKLFIPNFFLSFYFGTIELLLATSLISLMGISDFGSGISVMDRGELSSIFFIWMVLMVMSLSGLVVSILVWGMYPAMVKDYFAGKKISFSSAVRVSVKKFRFVFTSLMLCSVLPAALIALLFFQLILLYGSLEFWIYLAIVLVISFLYLFSFYLLMSSSVLGGSSIRAIFRESFSLTRKNPWLISKAAAFPFVVSILGWVAAFLSANPAFMALFWVLRVVSPIMATYTQTLNPTIYLGLRGKIK